jgi:acyl dehydratase
MNFYEDFYPGRLFHSESYTIDAQAIKAFASEFDPQPIHVDEAAARNTIFGGLVASGWHTAAAAMRLIVDSDLNPAGGGVGIGVEDLRWHSPVRPGDTLRIQIEVIEVRTSRSRPTHGVVKMRTTTFNQKDETVQVFITSIIVLRRTAR